MLSKGNVSQAVESLIQKGLLKRIPDLHDRRRIHLALLPASHSITADVDTLMDEYRGYLSDFQRRVCLLPDSFKTAHGKRKKCYERQEYT